MKKILTAILSIVGGWKKLIRKLKGKSEDDVYAERIVSGRSWEEFCDTIKAAGNSLYIGNTPKDPFNQAEGVRYLSRLTRVALNAFVENNDPKFPSFQRMVNETVKMGADNPDNYYLNAQISGDYEYRISGKRNDIHFLGFFTKNGNYGTTGGLAPCGVLDSNNMTLNEDGTFEVILSKEKRGQNWLKIEDGTSLLMVRQTFLDKMKETPAELEIERIGSEPYPENVSPKSIDEGLNTAGMFVAGATALFSKWANDFQKHSNRLVMFDPEVSNAAGGEENIIYYHSHWKLADDEVLYIETEIPECQSWNFQVNNYWMESLDYRYHDVCINKASANVDPDGKVRVIVAHKNAGWQNCLVTAGHNEGTMCWRWNRPAGDVMNEISAKVLKAAEVDDLLSSVKHKVSV
ncbi:MAG: DUF1214 domain-containing protein [Chitinophagales bacterium]|nr:DUF1214 domain-containing protein [Chitinophagales bacterium]